MREGKRMRRREREEEKAGREDKIKREGKNDMMRI